MASYGFAGYGAASPQGGYSQNGTFVPYGGYGPAPQAEGGQQGAPQMSSPFGGMFAPPQPQGAMGRGRFAPAQPQFVPGTYPQGSVYDQLRGANQLAYGQGLAGYAARQQDVINNLDVLGQNERSVLMDQYAQEKAQAQQNAISRGLANSTVRQSMVQGVDAQRDEAMRRVENEIRAQKLGLQSQLSGDLLGYAERQSAAQAQAALEQQRLGLMAQQMQQQQRQFEASLDLQRQDMFGRYNRQTATNPLPLYGWPGGGAGPGNGGYNFSQIYRG